MREIAGALPRWPERQCPVVRIERIRHLAERIAETMESSAGREKMTPVPSIARSQ
jgi:hypothetical protein